ncbi:hypothetical protein RRG08_057076 [Elysia crispata]|uniref:Uncharacterized protein n=1 Tax=Elysia crispata TaxID=231223 RepID=A0AAE1E1G6_9GAST|nr:hypothetical protein RRG08_057076 [Elysia crispata]
MGMGRINENNRSDSALVRMRSGTRWISNFRSGLVCDAVGINSATPVNRDKMDETVRNLIEIRFSYGFMKDHNQPLVKAYFLVAVPEKLICHCNGQRPSCLRCHCGTPMIGEKYRIRRFDL